MEVYGAVVSRLAMLGYTATEDDRPALEYLIAQCRVELLVDINRGEVPDGLFYTLVDMAAGSFLHSKLAAGGLEIGGLDFSQQPKSITEGDVSVTFAGGSDDTASPEARFLAVLDGMMHPPESVLGAFRRLRW
ncbi:MAG: hypothetical protein K2K53_03385 [Oscillospiraceae bacterium]|nr:hypothetical protein [Oscillospiraceae bacterium]